MNLPCARADVVNVVGAGSQKEGSRQAGVLVVTFEQVVTKTEVQRQFARNLPVVLHKRAEFDIPPVTDVGCQLCSRFRFKARIHTSGHSVRTVDREEEWIVEVVGGPSYVKLRVLNVAPYLCPDLDVVVAMVDRHHVRIVINMLLEKLRIAVVRAESHGTCIIADVDGRYARHGRDIPRVTTRIPGTPLIYDMRPKCMSPVDRAVGSDKPGRIGKSAAVRGGGQCVLTRPVELRKHPILGSGIPVDSAGGLVPVEEVPFTLSLLDVDRLVQHRGVQAGGHGLDRLEQIRHPSRYVRIPVVGRIFVVRNCPKAAAAIKTGQILIYRQKRRSLNVGRKLTVEQLTHRFLATRCQSLSTLDRLSELRTFGNRRRRKGGSPEPISLVGAEEEQFVLDDRATDGTAILIEMQRRSGIAFLIGEEGVRIQLVVADKLPQTPMEIVGARLLHQVRNGAGAIAVLRRLIQCE